MSTALARTEVVKGWTVAFGSDEEPRVLDVELAERLGYARPRKIRDLIRQLERDGKLRGVLSRPRQGRGLSRGKEETSQLVDEYMLTEAQALKIIAKSSTALADEILDEMIALFIEVRRGTVATSAAYARGDTIQAFLGDGDLRDNRELALRIFGLLAAIARGERCSWQKAHGALRKAFNLTSYRRIRIIAFAVIERWLINRLGTPPRGLPPSPPTPQLPLFGKVA